jgi:hypothetical protein
MAGDTRPHLSPADARVQTIGVDMLAKLDELVNSAFEQVVALPGHTGERENDALSLVATLASRVALQLICRLGDCKRIPIATAAVAAHKDLTQRMDRDVVELLSAAWAKH